MEDAGIANLTLREAIDQRRPLDVIQAIVRPPSRRWELREIDPVCNEYPLHRAMRLQLPPDVIKFLANRYRPAIKHRDAAGWLPLHLAARYSPVDIVRFIWKLWPGALREKTKEGGNLPLHLIQGSPDEMNVVGFLWNEWPMAVHNVNDEGWLPMHIAAAYMSMEAVEFFADRYDAALQKRTRRGSLPLHVAAANRATNGLNPTEVIQFLAVRWPPALEARDGLGGLPMHHAAKFSTVQAVAALADFWEDALKEKANDGALPLHLAATNVHDLEKVVILLADRYPQAVHVRDDSGRLPVHCAAMANNKDGLQLLAKLSPLGLQQRDSAGFLPLQVALYNGAAADAVQTLLEAYPEAVHAKSPCGLTAVHIAAKCKAPPDVVRLLVKSCSSGWLVQFLEDDGDSNPVQLEAVRFFANLAESGVPEQADDVVECGAIPHLVRLQSSPIYEIKDLAVRALIAGARACPRYHKALQEAQAARKLAALQDRSNDSEEALTAAQNPRASSSEGGRSSPHDSTPLSDPHDDEMGDAGSPLREVPSNDRAVEKSPPPPNRNDNVSGC
jgi:ankyrin repeat protein